MKKYLALLLTVLMTLTLSLGVFATEADPEDNFEFTACKRIGDNELLLTFSEDLDDNGVNHPYIAIRWCNVDWVGKISLAWDGDKPLQYAPSGKAFYKDENGVEDRSQIVLTFPEGSLDEHMWTPDYEVYLCIEEKNPEVTDHEHLNDVTSASGKNLLPNLPAGGTAWDGVYLPIDPGEYVGPEFETEPQVEETDPPIETEYKPTTKAPETEAPAATEAPKSTDAPAETKAAEKSGCGSVVASLAIVPMLLCAAYVSKKH